MEIIDSDIRWRLSKDVNSNPKLIAMFDSMSIARNHKGNFVILVKNLRRYDGVFISDHAWIEKPDILPTGLEKGDWIEFNAKVEKYPCRGKKVRWAKTHNYGLFEPTNVKFYLGDTSEFELDNIRQF